MTVSILIWMLVVLFIVLGGIDTARSPRTNWYPVGYWALLSAILICLTLKAYPISSS